MENKIYSKDTLEEILLLIDNIELKLVKRNLEARDEKECTASFGY